MLGVHVPKHFRDKYWAEEMGGLQGEIAKLSSLNADVKRIFEIDFKECRWVDPLPLMSLLIEIAHARNHNIPVVVKLPKPDDGTKRRESGPYQTSPNRLLLFLKNEGFLECINSLGIQIDDLLNIEIPARPSYEESLCIPMRLLRIPPDSSENANFANMTVEQLVVGIDTRLEAALGPQARERLIYKLRLAMQEILHNAQEHAYETNDQNERLLTIYVRFRAGSLGLDSAGRENFKKHVDEEGKHCIMLKRLDQDWLTPRPGCLEIFALDRGVGMVHNFKKANKLPQVKYPFVGIMKQTFLDGESTKTTRQTKCGGLNQLHSYLQLTADYIRTLEGGIWFGSQAPIPRSTAVVNQLTKGMASIVGLAMHLRLGWMASTDVKDTWHKFKEGRESELWSELSLSNSKCAESFAWFRDRLVYDERFGSLKKFGHKNDWVLWNVRPALMKWDIINTIQYKIAPSIAGKAILIIADIPSYEAEIYAASLNECKALGPDDWPIKFTHVVLCTNRWSFAVVTYKKHDKNHGFSELKKDTSDINLMLPVKPIPTSFRLGVVRWLKFHDSYIFWQEVEKNKSLFVREQISWGSPLRIDGYLNFPQTTHNTLCAKIYRASLARVFGVLPPANVKVNPLDRLTMPVLRDIYDYEVYEPVCKCLSKKAASASKKDTDKPVIQLALGSILVSGTTLDNAVNSSLNLHFFVHLSSPKHGLAPALLFWLQKGPVSSSEPRLKRIGNTAFIAPEGWKSFELPRFDKNGDCIGTRTPELTYHDWQSAFPLIVKCGHWFYEGHHDYLTINIVGAVNAAFFEKTDLAIFLIMKILPFIGINKDDIDHEWHRRLDEYPTINSENHGILVYRSHPNSELVIQKLLGILKETEREKALSRIISVLPIRMHWSGSALLIPPLVREEIRKEINPSNQPSRNVMLFDDAAITGRTLLDLRAMMSSLGAKSITTVIIANRLRQPADGEGVDRLIYYWRLDVPVIGQEGKCPFCHTLHSLETLKTHLTSKEAMRLIGQWARVWEAISPLDNWSAGLRTLPLNPPLLKRPFCYRKTLNNAPGTNCDHLSFIDIVTSTGLVIRTAELHAMTSRDDYVLKKIEEFPQPEIRIQLAASQLLLFGSEFDLHMRMQLVSSLIKNLNELEDNSSHSALAVLTTLWGLRLLMDFESRKNVAQIASKEQDFRNYAIRILLAYLVSENLITDADTDAFKIGNRLLSTASLALDKRLKYWFLATLSPNGNPHAEPIPVLINELDKGNSASDLLIKDALDSIDHLRDIIDEIQSGIVIKEEYKTFYSKKTALASAYEFAIDELDQMLNGNKFPENINKAAIALTKYMTTMKSVADAYFHRIPSAIDYKDNRTFEEKALQILIDKIEWKTANIDTENNLDRIVLISRKQEFYFDTRAQEVWIPWHRDIAAIVSDLMKNAVYTKNEIDDPWGVESNKAHLWIHAIFQNDRVEIILVNSSNRNPVDIFNDLKKYRWTPLEEIGGEILLDEKLSELKRIGIMVRIPYAAYLSDNRR